MVNKLVETVKVKLQMLLQKAKRKLTREEEEEDEKPAVHVQALTKVMNLLPTSIYKHKND